MTLDSDQQVRNRQAMLRLLQNRNNLLNRKSLPLHGQSPNPHPGKSAEKLIHKPDHFPHVTSPK
jgi:hypothetical protein